MFITFSIGTPASRISTVDRRLQSVLFGSVAESLKHNLLIFIRWATLFYCDVEEGLLTITCKTSRDIDNNP